MRHKYLDLLLVLGIAVANVVWALLATSTDLTSFSVVNIILAVPLVLVAPGYALSALFFPQRSMEAVQRLAFTIALSVALTILSGFLLNQLPTGLRPLPWALLLGSDHDNLCLAGLSAPYKAASRRTSTRRSTTKKDVCRYPPFC